jgi:hypothetical protein
VLNIHVHSYIACEHDQTTCCRTVHDVFKHSSCGYATLCCISVASVMDATVRCYCCKSSALQQFTILCLTALRSATLLLFYPNNNSMLDLMPEGSDWLEVVQLARAVEAAGATLLNTGIGWHEARIPTIATSVPRAAFTWVTRKLKVMINYSHDHTSSTTT